MTGKELQAARARLGRIWGWGRGAHLTEMARALRLASGDVIRNMERRDEVSGPISVAVEMMLAGAPPADSLETIKRRELRGSNDRSDIV